MDQGMRIGSVGLMMLLAMPGAQAQLPMDIVWQQAPWTFESGATSSDGALGPGGAGTAYTRWFDEGPGLGVPCVSDWEGEYGFDAMGVPAFYAGPCHLDEQTFAITNEGTRIWGDMIGTTHFIYPGPYWDP